MLDRVVKRTWQVVADDLKADALEHVVWRGWNLVPITITVSYTWRIEHEDELLVEVAVWGTDVDDETSFTAWFATGPGATNTPLNRAPAWVQGFAEKHKPSLAA